MGKWLDRLKDHTDADNLRSARGWIDTMRAKGIMVMTHGSRVHLEPERNLTPESLQIVRSLEPFIFALLAIENASRGDFFRPPETT